MAHRKFVLPNLKMDLSSSQTLNVYHFARIHWPFQDSKMEVPTIYKAHVEVYVRGYTFKIWPYYMEFEIPIDVLPSGNFT